MGDRSARPLRRTRHLLEYFVFRTIVCLVQALPYRMSVRCARGLAFVFFHVLPRKWSRYHVARENLRTAFGDTYSDEQMDRLILGMWEHLFRVVIEMIQMPRRLRLYNVKDNVHIRRSADSVKALCCGRPVMVLSGHFGNWEMAVSTFGLFGFPMGVVARDLDNPWLHEWFARWRQLTGHRLLSKKGGGGDMVEYLERRGNLALLADQDAGSRGLFVPFFGKEASTFKSVALLALQYRAVIVIGYARRLPDDFRQQRWVQYELGCEEVIDTDDFTGPDAIRELTVRYTHALERVVRLAPEQYFWVHRRWKSQPRVRKQRLRQAA